MNPADELLARLDGRAESTDHSTGDPLCKEAAALIRTLTVERDEARTRIENAAQSMAEARAASYAAEDIASANRVRNSALSRAGKAEAALATAREEGRREMAEEAAKIAQERADWSFEQMRLAAGEMTNDTCLAVRSFLLMCSRAIRQAAQTEKGGGR